jgi:hypothetical protein
MSPWCTARCSDMADARTAASVAQTTDGAGGRDDTLIVKVSA